MNYFYVKQTASLDGIGVFRHNSFFVLTLLVAVFLWRPLVVAEDSFEAFVDGDAVPVQVFQLPHTLDLLLIGISESDIVLRPQGEDRGERIYLPLDTVEPYSLHYTFPEKYWEAQALLREKKHVEGLAQMRSVIYPLVPFLVVPAEKFNIRNPVLRFFEALLESGREDEAIAMVGLLPLERLDSDYLKAVLSLAQSLAEQERQQASLRVLMHVPLSDENFEQSALMMDVADLLRERGHIVEALSLYRRLHHHDTPQKTAALLWLAYCHLRENRTETARLLLNQVGGLEYTDTFFPLKQLILGRLYLRENDSLQAVLAVSEGIVSCQIDYAWTAELLYLLGVCYEAIEQLDTACSVYRSLQLAFPASPWAAKGKKRLTRIMR